MRVLQTGKTWIQTAGRVMVALALLSGIAYAEPLDLVAGSANGWFTYDNGTYIGPKVEELTYTGNEFEGPPEPLNFGTLTLGPSWLYDNYFPYRFRLLIDFYVPVDVKPDPVKLSADVMGLVVWKYGGVYVDFDNDPIHLTYDGGAKSFDLTVSDALVFVGKSATIEGTTSAVSVSVNETHPLLTLAAMGAGFLLLRKRLAGTAR